MLPSWLNSFATILLQADAIQYPPDAAYSFTSATVGTFRSRIASAIFFDGTTEPPGEFMSNIIPLTLSSSAEFTFFANDCGVISFFCENGVDVGSSVIGPWRLMRAIKLSAGSFLVFEFFIAS